MKQKLFGLIALIFLALLIVLVIFQIIRMMVVVGIVLGALYFGFLYVKEGFKDKL
jgi:predicted membrane protein